MFKDTVLRPVRDFLGHSSLAVPSAIGWSLERASDGANVIVVSMSQDDLCTNMQTNVAAAPAFALCLAYWLERSTGRPVRIRVELSGHPPSQDKTSNQLRHWRRSQLLLQTYELALGDRFEVLPGSQWQWPTAPMLNCASGERASAPSANKKKASEHHLEVALANTPAVRDAFSAHVAPIRSLERQLPVGLFEGDVAANSAWTPGGSSQVDLWALSEDGEELHIFELKAEGNKMVGMIPEALYYARLLRAVAAGSPDGVEIGGDGEALSAIRGARRVVAWLTAPVLHPLIYSESRRDSPLVWLNAGLAKAGIEFRVLPLTQASSQPRFDFGRIWP